MPIRALYHLLIVAILLAAGDLSAQTFRICSYNLLDGPVSSTGDQMMRVLLQAMGDQEVLGRTGPIDLLAFQEGPQNANVYPNIEANFEIVFGGNYSSTISVPDTAGCRTGFFYNADRLQLLGAITLTTGLTHNTRRALFRPVGGTSADNFYIYSIHLKAGSSDAATRATEAMIIRNNADSLPTAANIIYSGDFNIRGSNEAAYQNLFAAGTNGSAVESLNAPFGFRNPVLWNDNLAFLPFHTQASNAAMDDRFDTFYFNQRLMDGVGLEYVRGSLFALGNNGTHTLDSNINTGTGTAGFSSEIVNFSDHLPVCCDLEFGQSAIPFNELRSVDAFSTRTVRQNGPVGGSAGDNQLEVEGTANGNFASFGVIDFSLSDQLAKNESAAIADNIVLELRQNNFAFSQNGPISVYLASAEATSIPINAAIQFQSGQNGLACVPPILADGAIKVATYAAVHRSGGLLPNGTVDPMALYGTALESAIVNALNSGTNLRFLVTPDQAGTAATYAGFANGLGGPSLTAELVVQDTSTDIFASSFQLVVGTQGSGTLVATQSSDNKRLNFLSGLSGTTSHPQVQVQFVGTLPESKPNSLQITLESRANSSNLAQSIEMLNFETNSWEALAFSSIQIEDDTIEVHVKGERSRFIGAGNLIVSRITIVPQGPVLFQPWTMGIDLFKWTIE